MRFRCYLILFPVIFGSFPVFSDGIFAINEVRYFEALNVEIKLRDVYNLSSNPHQGGIIGTIYPGHYDSTHLSSHRIRLDVYKKDNSGHRTDLIYGCYISQTSHHWQAESFPVFRNDVFYGFSRQVEYESTDIKKLVQYTNSSWAPLLTGVPNLFSRTIKVDIVVKIDNALLSSINIPGLGVQDVNILFHQPPPTRTDLAYHIYKNPQLYPDFMFMAAHRGYWRNAPENSIQAFRDAIHYGIEMVEIDVRKTKDDSVMVAHDIHLGRLTTLPAHLNQPIYMKNGRVVISKLNFCDIRPDLCPGNTNPPVRLLDHNGNPAEVMPTLREALRSCKDSIMVDIDKIEGFYYPVYKTVLEEGMLNQVVVKGRYEYPDSLLAKVPQSELIDWKRFMFTPVYFSDADWDFEASLNSYFYDPRFNISGVELIYRNEHEFLHLLRGIVKYHNRRIIQFPQFPENTLGVYNPKQYVYSDVDVRYDRRNDWDWLLEPDNRPDMIISDRLEVLVNLLNTMGLRNGPFIQN